MKYGALPLEIDFACALCVGNALVDVHGGPVINCAVVRTEGGILALRPPWPSSIINGLIMWGVVHTVWIPTVEYLLSGIIDYRTLSEVDYGLKKNCTQVIEGIQGPLKQKSPPETLQWFTIVAGD